MHLAVPPYTSLAYLKKPLVIPTLCWKRIQTYLGFSFAAAALLLILIRYLDRSNSARLMPLASSSWGSPVVIVTVLDGGTSKPYLETIRQNRQQYARRHGYETFFPYVSDYKLDGAGTSWAPVSALRHALAKFPACRFVWFLHQNALIMNPALKIENHIIDRLEDLMIRNQPVIPPGSVIKTYSHLKGDTVDLVLTQDHEGLTKDSLILRNSAWSRYFLDTWFEPLYRSYNFQRAETHALEHMVQWHPTILSKLAVVPQDIMNSYSTDERGARLYKEGDLVVNLARCREGMQDCVEEADVYMKDRI